MLHQRCPIWQAHTTCIRTTSTRQKFDQILMCWRPAWYAPWSLADAFKNTTVEKSRSPKSWAVDPSMVLLRRQFANLRYSRIGKETRVLVSTPTTIVKDNWKLAWNRIGSSCSVCTPLAEACLVSLVICACCWVDGALSWSSSLTATPGCRSWMSRRHQMSSLHQICQSAFCVASTTCLWHEICPDLTWNQCMGIR